MAFFGKLVVNAVCIALCLGLGIATSASAQTERVGYDRQLMERAASTNDEIGIAFLKMSNNFPDFAQVVMGTDTYKTLDSLAQQDYLSKTVGRYQNAFMTYAPGKSDLLLRLKVNAMFKRRANGESTITLTTFNDQPVVYFPFYFAGFPIALIIKDMEMFKDIHLNAVETDIVYKRLSLDGKATLLLQVYPIAADDKKPVTFDNIQQYPLLAEIGYIGLVNRRAEQIWAWKNTKYAGKSPLGGIPPKPAKSLGQ